MEALLEEIGHPTTIPFPVLAARIMLAALLGAVIGFEREWRNHAAGLRTHIMICVAAAVFGILTMEITLSPTFSDEAMRFDPIRSVEAVTAGVAFLAAGLIWSGRGKVHGLTTGAGMWLAGAIGLSSGLGLWQIALLSTAIAVLVLGVIHSFSHQIGEDGAGEKGPHKEAEKPAAAPSDGDPTKPR